MCTLFLCRDINCVCVCECFPPPLFSLVYCPLLLFYSVFYCPVLCRPTLTQELDVTISSTDPAPVLQQLPIATGPIVEGDQSFRFQCEFVYGPTDPDQVFEVLWTFNGQTDPSITTQTLTAGQRVATLSGEKLAAHLDTNVSSHLAW